MLTILFIITFAATFIGTWTLLRRIERHMTTRAIIDYHLKQMEN